MSWSWIVEWLSSLSLHSPSQCCRMTGKGVSLSKDFVNIFLRVLLACLGSRAATIQLWSPPNASYKKLTPFRVEGQGTTSLWLSLCTRPSRLLGRLKMRQCCSEFHLVYNYPVGVQGRNSQQQQGFDAAMPFFAFAKAVRSRIKFCSSCLVAQLFIIC